MAYFDKSTPGELNSIMTGFVLKHGCKNDD